MDSLLRSNIFFDAFSLIAFGPIALGRTSDFRMNSIRCSQSCGILVWLCGGAEARTNGAI